MSFPTRARAVAHAAIPLLLFGAFASWSTPAHAWIRHIEQQAGISLSTYEWAFNQCVSIAIDSGLSGSDLDEFLGACCGDVEDACYSACGSNSDCQGDCALASVTCEDRGSVDFYGARVDPSISYPVVEEIHPAPRVDFCLDGDAGCGAPAAHTVCQRALGPDYGARSFTGDGVPTSLEDPTWQLGRWYPRQPYGTGEGFELVLCDRLEGASITFSDVADDPDLDGVPAANDNCPGLANPFQRNADGDIWGDACDPQPNVVLACSNGLDDDGDGLADEVDPGCTDFYDDDEREASLVCDNGVDDDGDGLVDLSDPDCAGPNDVSEAAARCADGIDDDGDGLVDLDDRGCTGPADDSEFGDVWTTEYDGSQRTVCIFFSCSSWSWTDDDLSRHVGDVDGDGRDDVVAFGRGGVEVALAIEDAFAAGSVWTDTIRVTSKPWGYSEAVFPRFVADVDGDGRSDALYFDEDVVYVARSTGSAFLDKEAWSQPGELGSARLYEQFAGSGASGVGEVLLGDVDADGLVDVVLFDDGGAAVALNTGTGFASPSYWSQDFGSDHDSAFHFGQRSRHLADVNGDGLLDLVGFTPEGTWLAFGTGAGFESTIASHPEFGYPWGARELNFLADVDGDGRDDIVAFDSTHMRVGRGGVDGFGPEEYWLSDFGAGGRDFRNDLRIVEDLNGDGLADFLISDVQGVSAWHSTGEGPGERMLLGYGFTKGPNEHWDNRGATPRSLADVDGDGQRELVGFGLDGLAVAELGAAIEPLPVPEPTGALGVGAIALLLAGRGRLAPTGAIGVRSRRRRRAVARPDHTGLTDPRGAARLVPGGEA